MGPWGGFEIFTILTSTSLFLVASTATTSCNRKFFFTKEAPTLSNARKICKSIHQGHNQNFLESVQKGHSRQKSVMDDSYKSNKPRADADSVPAVAVEQFELREDDHKSSKSNYTSSLRDDQQHPQYIEQAMPVSDSETCDRRSKDDIESGKSTLSSSNLARCNSLTGVAIMNTSSKISERQGAALASEVFDHFCHHANTLKSILRSFRYLCEILRLKPTEFPCFYPKLKSKLRTWKAQALWAKFDKRAAHKCYSRGKACAGQRVLVIGAGPCGLRTAIEAQFLGAKVVVLEKRDRFSRNNVLHLWPYNIHDLRGLGAKKFYGKFCAGAIDHISIRQLQCILLKVALLLGVEVYENVGFECLLEPEDIETGWRAVCDPPEHRVSRQYEFDVLIGADGKRNTLTGFKRKEFRGKLAIAITANFIHRHTEAESHVEEISGVAFIFNQKFFNDLNEAKGISLENIVYYKDETHYFVMTAKKQSLLNKGVIISNETDTAKLLSPENIDTERLFEYAREAADFATNEQLPHLDFAVNHYGKPDVAMFDFTSMFQVSESFRNFVG